jgi:hypothetical protein
VRLVARVQDWSTRASRAELVLAFASAALTGGLLNVIQEVLHGRVDRAVLAFGVLLALTLSLTVTAWVAARRLSLDLGVCVVIRRGQLQNRSAITQRLAQSTRDWVPLELVDDHPGAWSAESVPEAVRRMIREIGKTLTASVGQPRILLAVSASDAIGFFLGHTLRPLLLGTEVHLLTLPTGSQEWKSERYRAGEDLHRAFFDRVDEGSIFCPCSDKRGAGILDAARSPGHDPDIVLRSLIDQQLICCRDAIWHAPARPFDVALSQESAVQAAHFVRARARMLTESGVRDHVDLALTCGPEVGVLAGLVLSGFCRWRVWEFAPSERRWERRWDSV